MNKPHKKLEVWKLAMEITQDIYNLTEEYPSSEKYGFISQMRNSALSIPSNVAEGAGRNTKKEFVNFLHIAQGSLSELDTQLELSKRLGYLDNSNWEVIDKKLLRQDKMLSGLIKNQKSRL